VVSESLFDQDALPPGSLRRVVDRAVTRLEPVFIEHVRECHFKAKPTETVAGRTVKRRGCARCGRGKHDPAHYGAPPSLNVLGSGDPMAYQEAKRRWSAILHLLLEASGLPKGLEHVLVEGEATFPDRARRDQGNYRVLIEKALGDVLTAGGWLADDDWGSYEFGNLTYSYEKGVSATRLMLFPTLPTAL
jgi:hypothetical protein